MPKLPSEVLCIEVLILQRRRGVGKEESEREKKGRAEDKREL